MNTAILIDGSFYLNRARKIWKNLDPAQAANKLHEYCMAHMMRCKKDNENCQLYRIFYYDCPPAQIQTVHPLTGENIRYSDTPQAKWRFSFFEELKKKRKVALRLGVMDAKNPTWALKGRKLNQLLNNTRSIKQLTKSDIHFEVRQKGVDMRLGLDIASMAYKHQVQQIILIAGDSDFVPAAKIARREGIDFILDPLYTNVKDDLFEHIDGLRSMIHKPDKNGNFDPSIIKTYQKRKIKRPEDVKRVKNSTTER